MDNQFYPTPYPLAHKAYCKFKNRNFKRVLEPSAGCGDLLEPFLTCGGRTLSRNKPDYIDCIELDFNSQAVLREKKLNIVGHNFMAFNGVAMYSHIIMNPPFNVGVDHVLKAWELLFNGELVAILNAESIKNPYSEKRKLLNKLIDRYGTVEFIQDAFLDPETQRKTPVEIALIHLVKEYDIKQTYTAGLKEDKGHEIHLNMGHDVAFRGDLIGNAVKVFDVAVEAYKRSIIASCEAAYYGRRIGKLLSDDMDTNNDTMDYQASFNNCYEELKKRAWQKILESSDFTAALSSNARSKLYADFDNIVKLEFTEDNIRGFLRGLIEAKPEMNLQMAIDCFDLITKYCSDNRAYYRGWKSNDKHRTNAWRIKTTRFILPVRMSWDNVDYTAIDKIRDFEKTFLMLDNKQKADVSLPEILDRCGYKYDNQRVVTDYFEFRLYRQAGTIHFYPTKPDLIDKLNLLVGRQRQWIPSDETDKNFWKQYEKAEQVTAKMKLKKPRWGDVLDNEITEEHTRVCGELNILLPLLNGSNVKSILESEDQL